MRVTVWLSVFIQRLRVNSYNTHHTWTHDVCIRTHRQWFKAQGIMGGVTLYPGGLSVCSCVITPHSVCQVLCGDTFSLLDRCWASVSSLDHSTSSPVLHILHSLLSFAHFLSFSSLLPALLPSLFLLFAFLLFSSPLLSSSLCSYLYPLSLLLSIPFFQSSDECDRKCRENKEKERDMQQSVFWSSSFFQPS